MSIRVLREADALQRVGADEQLVVQPQFAFHVAIEGRAGQADHDDHHADVDDVAAVAARVAARQQPRGRRADSCRSGCEMTPAPRRNSERMAVSTAAETRKATSA